jgi:hypothetical protein
MGDLNGVVSFAIAIQQNVNPGLTGTLRFEARAWT